MNFFKRIEGNNTFGEPYFSKIFTAFLETLNKELLLSLIKKEFKITTIDSIDKYEIEEQKMVYFDAISFITPDPNSSNGKPDIGIKIKDSSGNEHYIIIEVKINNYSFALQDNQEKLDLYHNIIKNIPNTHLIGISDRYYDDSNYEKFTHLLWGDIFNYFLKQNGYLNKIVAELKDYKNNYGKLMEAFPDNYQDLIKSSFIYRQNEANHKEFLSKINTFFSEISIIIKSKLNDDLNPTRVSKPSTLFPIKEILHIQLVRGVYYNLQFRVNDKMDSIFIHLFVIPKDLFQSEGEKFKNGIEGILIKDGSSFSKGFEDERVNEYKLVIGSNGDLDWSNSEWVSKTRETAAVTASNAINKLYEFLNTYQYSYYE